MNGNAPLMRNPTRFAALPVRGFTTLILAAIAAGTCCFSASIASAEESRHLAKVGEVWMGTPETAAWYRESLRRGLYDLGYREGSNITLIPRYAEGKLERLPSLVEELVSEKVDVMFLVRPAVPIAQKLAPFIPVVCATFSDPVAEGVVASLSRPGVNVTGLSWQSPESAGKRIELVKELMPGVRRVAMIWGEDDAGAPLKARATEEVSLQAGIGLRAFSFRDATSLERALVAVRQMKAQLLLVSSGLILSTFR